jgi:hypothetical protein
MPAPRPVIDLSKQTVTHTALNIPYEFEPKIGKEVMEFWPGASHPGHDIHVLHDVVGKSSTDIHDLLGTMDKRVLQGMPAEVSSAIDSGDISHIFRTNPGRSEAFTDLPQSVQDSLGGPQNTGSIYFRRKTGETARWKLPEIGTNDKGWNANKGHEIFSAATAYPDDTYKISKLNGLSKAIGKPDALHALDQSLEAELQPHGYNVSKANIERIRSRNPNLLGSEALDQVLPIPGTPPLTSGPSVSTANATKVTPLAGEYDTGATAAKVASGQPIVTPPPVTSTSVPPVSVPPTTKPPISRGPTVGAPTSVRTTPGPHGAAITPSTAPTPPTAPKTPIIPATSPTAPTAKIVNKTAQQDVDLTAREALRRMGGDIRTARKPGQKLLSADGSKAMAEAVTQGIKGSRNLKMLAVGSALGLGGYTANRIAGRGDTSDLGG